MPFLHTLCSMYMYISYEMSGRWYQENQLSNGIKANIALFDTLALHISHFFLDYPMLKISDIKGQSITNSWMIFRSLSCN
jgi:hypothetical protein